MSLDRCAACGITVDTDYFPEFYREEYEDKLICDKCIEGLLEFEKEDNDE